MNLTLRVLGLEVLHIEASTDERDDDGPGDAMSTPIGFTARWDTPEDVECE